MSDFKFSIMANAAKNGNHNAARALAGEAAARIRAGEKLPTPLADYIADALLGVGAGQSADQAFKLTGRNRTRTPAQDKALKIACEVARVHLIQGAGLHKSDNGAYSIVSKKWNVSKSTAEKHFNLYRGIAMGLTELEISTKTPEKK